MELVIGLIVGAAVTYLYFVYNEPPERDIEKNLHETYRGEELEKRAKRASK